MKQVLMEPVVGAADALKSIVQNQLFSSFLINLLNRTRVLTCLRVIVLQL